MVVGLCSKSQIHSPHPLPCPVRDWRGNGIGNQITNNNSLKSKRDYVLAYQSSFVSYMISITRSGGSSHLLAKGLRGAFETLYYQSTRSVVRAPLRRCRSIPCLPPAPVHINPLACLEYIDRIQSSTHKWHGEATTVTVNSPRSDPH